MRLSRIAYAIVTFFAIATNSLAFAKNVENELNNIATTTDIDITLYSTSTTEFNENESTSDFSTTDFPSTTDLTTTDEPNTTETTTIDESNATESTTTDEIETTQFSTTAENDIESTSVDVNETTTFMEVTTFTDEKTTIKSKKTNKKCKDGLILPAWKPDTNLTWGDRFSRGLCYFLAMCYLFLGKFE